MAIGWSSFFVVKTHVKSPSYYQVFLRTKIQDAEGFPSLLVHFLFTFEIQRSCRGHFRFSTGDFTDFCASEPAVWSSSRLPRLESRTSGFCSVLDDSVWALASSYQAQLVPGPSEDKARSLTNPEDQMVKVKISTKVKICSNTHQSVLKSMKYVLLLL